MSKHNKPSLKLSRTLQCILSIGIFTLSTTICYSEAQRLNNSVILYEEPPSSYELAKVLYPAKTRSIVLDKETTQAIQPESVAFMIKFEYDSVLVKEESLAYLDALGDMLNFAQLKQKSLQIEGHADATGDENYNLKLSESRAVALKKYLQSVHRISPSRLHTLGFGESRLLDKSDPAAQVNRRAEFRPL